MRQRALLLRVVLVACGSLLSGPRGASGHEEVHTNARYVESVHGKPVIVYKAVRHFWNETPMSNRAIVRAKGTLDLVPVPTCIKEQNPCPFDADGKRQEMRACKANQTVFVHLKDTKSNQTVVQNFTHEVHTKCYCKSNSSSPCSEGNSEKVLNSKDNKDNSIQNKIDPSPYKEENKSNEDSEEPKFKGNGAEVSKAPYGPERVCPSACQLVVLASVFFFIEVTS